MKKSFKNQNVALNFISTPDDSEDASADIYTQNYQHSGENSHLYEGDDDENDLSVVIVPKESKSQRLQLLLKPSTYNALKTFAKSRHTSINNVVNTVMESFLESNNRKRQK